MSKTVFYDTHAHLTYPDFAAELPAVVSRAGAAGIEKIIAIGTDEQSSRAALALAERFEPVYAVVGWHPSHAAEAPEDFRPLLRELARHPKVVALGETGLDHHRLPGAAAEAAAGKRKQRDLFVQHLEVAAELGLNCVVHTRDSFDEAFAALLPFVAGVRAVFHCFAESPAAVERVLAVNSLISFTGILTFKSGQNVRDALAAAPLGKFMLETDSPYLAPVPYRGKRCEPAYVKEISETAAQVKGCSLTELSAATCAAAREFFHLPD